MIKRNNPARAEGINIFAILLIITSISHILKIMESSDTYFVEYFKNMPWWLMYARYWFSWFQRAVGILVALGLLARKEIARKVGIGLGIFALTTIYWKHPYDVLQIHTHWLDQHWGALLPALGLPGVKYSDYVLPGLIGLYLWDFTFWGIFFYYFTRPSVKAQFK